MKLFYLPFLIALAILTTIAGPILAQDSIGIYFDSPFTTTNFDTMEPNEVVSGWLVLKDASNTGEISGLRATIEATTASGFDTSVFWNPEAGGQNFAVLPYVDIWYPTPIPWADEIVLATMTAIVPDPAVETEFHISSYHSPDIYAPLDYPVFLPTYTHGPDNTFASLTQSSGNNYLAVATINSDGVDPGFPDLTWHYNNAQTYGVVGETLTGAFRYFTNYPDRDLQAQVVPWGGLEIQAIGDMYNRFPVLHPYTDEPVWVLMPVVGNVSFQWRITPDTPGSYLTGYQLVAGGDILHEITHNMTAFATPCVNSGHSSHQIPIDSLPPTSWYPISPVDGVWEFGIAEPGLTKVVCQLSVRNISRDSDIEVFPQISGSSAFRLEPDGPYPMTLGHYDSHSVSVVFDPAVPGIHTATLDFGPAACEPLQLTGGDSVADTPDRFENKNGLVSVHPNPFNPITTVVFEMARPGRARLTVHDLQGRLIATLADENFSFGRVERAWTGMDSAGRRVASGSYVVRLKSGGLSESRSITLLK